jgi:hypothetical protein
VNNSLQLKLWVRGESVHNHDAMAGGKKLQGGECCPDFSCCKPKLKASVEEREKFLREPKARPELLSLFLKRLLEGEGHVVNAVGFE